MALRKEEGPAPTLAEHRVELEAKEYEDRRTCMHFRGLTCAVRSVGSLLICSAMSRDTSNSWIRSRSPSLGQD